MLTVKEQTKILWDLEELEVVDVYFAKGTLFVINEYDLGAVTNYLQANKIVCAVQTVSSDEYQC